MRLQIGSEVGSYRIVGIAGRGATGVVFQVKHLVTGRVEAMKVLAEDMTADQDQLRRFLRESRMQARLNHPHLVSVHNAFFRGQTLCLVMQWVEGQSLSRKIEAGPVPLPQAVDIACQVLSALAHAHEHGVIHRDVKPANILVDREGRAKLTDFGLARPCTDLELTQPGIALGSVHYMPPEQVRGLPTADARADLYSTGAILYEMATGRKPFEGPDAFAVMKAQVEQTPVPPAQLVPGLPARLNQAILRALNKDPARRFQTAGEFLLELEAVRARLRAKGWRGGRKLRLALAAATAAAMLLTISLGHGRRRPVEAAREPLLPPPVSTLLAMPKPPPDALILPQPPVVESEPESAIETPAASPWQGRTVSTARSIRPRRVESRRLPAPSAAPEVRTPPPAAAAPAQPLPPVATAAPDTPKDTPMVERAAGPPQEAKKPGAVRRFFGKLNPLRLRRKGAEKPDTPEPPERPD